MIEVTADLIVFFILALISIFAAVMVMEANDIFHAALFLALLFAVIAGFYILLLAEFIAAIQILVYGGAIVVLILFAIVLTNRAGSVEEQSLKNLLMRTAAIIGFVALLVQPILCGDCAVPCATGRTTAICMKTGRVTPKSIRTTVPTRIRTRARKTLSLRRGFFLPFSCWVLASH